MLKNRFGLFGFICFLAIASGCSHGSYYTPEIGGKGALFAGNGVIFPIPSQNPELEMKLVSRGFGAAPPVAHLPSGTRMLHIRMYFRAANKKAALEDAKAYLDPKEQFLVFPDDTKIPPKLVRASSKHKPLIYVGGPNKQVVDLFFPVDEKHPDRDIQWFSFSWTIHYGTNLSQQTLTRFDRHSTAPQVEDAGFSFDEMELDQQENAPIAPYEPWDWW